MNEKQKPQGMTKEMDLRRLVGLLMHKAWLIGLVALLAAVLTFLASYYLITPKYESSAMFYVNNNSGISLDDIKVGITSSDKTARELLVKTYIVLLKTRPVLLDVLDMAGVDMDYRDLEKMITAEAVDGTEIFRVT